MRNPFGLPGLDGEPSRPLCPWDEPRDDVYYVAVDSTQEQFDAFQLKLGDPANLTRKGRLVLVTGHQGCGKTSLVNRCARWAHERLASSGIRGEIVDLTADGTESQSVEKRMATVCGRLIDELAYRKRLSADAVADLRTAQDQLDITYPKLKNVLAETEVVVIILLPPSGELRDEIVNYAKLARARILLFAESSYPEVASACKAQLRPADAVIYLAVSPITLDDGWRFVSDRLAKNPQDVAPQINEATVRSIVAESRRAMSIKELSLILHRVFDEAIKELAPEVDFDYIKSFYYAVGGNLESRDG
jgi:energy-coupling factor transporter ATP-binding protein EcfA2